MVKASGVYKNSLELCFMVVYKVFFEAISCGFLLLLLFFLSWAGVRFGSVAWFFFHLMKGIWALAVATWAVIPHCCYKQQLAVIPLEGLQ